MDLQEEVDNLRVQVSQHAATIHEMNVALQQEREEVDFLKIQEERNLHNVTPRQNFKEELRSIRLQLQNKEGALERLTSEKEELEQVKEKWDGEKRIMKAELNTCKQEVAKKRMEIADLKKEISRLQREVYRRGASKKGGRAKRKNQVKKFQRSLNHSIEQMNQLVDNFGDDGWEEISSDSDEEDDSSPWSSTDTDGRHATARTQESLGVAIVRAAKETGDRPQGTPTNKTSDRQVESVEEHIRRMNNKNEPPVRDEDLPKKKRSRVVPKIQLRPVSTQTSTSNAVPIFGHWKRKVSGHGVYQINTLKQRLGALQQQLQVLRATKVTLSKSINEYKDNNEQLQADLSLANQRLRVLRNANQKLALDIDLVQHEKMRLEMKLSLKEESDASNTPRKDRSDQDWKAMEKRIKNTSSEVCRQSTLIKSLRTELDEKDQQLKMLQEKLGRLERDNSQKRILLEDNKLRLKIAQEHEKTDIAAFDDLEARVKQLTETTEKQKTSLESCRKRLSVGTREKRDLEDQFIRTKAELERKTKTATELHAKNIDLESMCTELEAAAQEQLRELARRSEVAIDTAHTKLRQAHNTVQGFHIFIQTLADNLLNSTQHARALAKERARHLAAAAAVSEDGSQDSGVAVRAESLQKAQQLAKNILNISDTDLEDIMNPYSQPEEPQEEEEWEATRKNDRKWAKKCQRILASDDFAMPLVDMFMEKVEETMMLLGPA